MKNVVVIIVAFLLYLLSSAIALAHPGSGIVVDKQGQVYFTDTGKGIWKIDTQGKLTFIPASAFHWMTMDTIDSFARAQKSFGGYFEKVTLQSSRPSLITCSDFPVVINKDGNLYYADTRPGSPKITRRTPEGNESALTSDKAFEHVGGIAAGIDGSIYITEGGNIRSNTIRKIMMNGTVSTVATFVGKEGKDLPLETVPSYCRGLAVDPQGNIYVAATGNRCVLKVTPQGKITILLQEASPWSPTGVAVFRGEVYVLEWKDVPASQMEDRDAWIPRVRKISKDGKVTTLATVSRK